MQILALEYVEADADGEAERQYQKYGADYEAAREAVGHMWQRHVALAVVRHCLQAILAHSNFVNDLCWQTHTHTQFP